MIYLVENLNVKVHNIIEFNANDSEDVREKEINKAIILQRKLCLKPCACECDNKFKNGEYSNNYTCVKMM